ncbi:STAS domain-containing protein [Actinoplanes aureus]|uniref:STAS domain-containing protein n=1 Tax=Actinoplanes aureus TaxID=2792083 RepID=A0A931G068_9ACTN|nr:STAS domain-containing protein [Actinoplanes aureus]MBG0566428.1 STAS domain-containing protein [Actinoplanes aureus]
MTTEPGSEPPPVDPGIELRRHADTLSCEVRDEGGGTGMPHPRLPAGDTPGGRGLWLAQQLTAGLTINAGPSGVGASVIMCLASAVPAGIDAVSGARPYTNRNDTPAKEARPEKRYPTSGHRSHHDENRCVVALHGELDMTDVDDLHELLADALGQAPSVVLDLSAVTFIDSTIINTLIKTHQAAGAAGYRFAVANATRQVGANVTCDSLGSLRLQDGCPN